MTYLESCPFCGAVAVLCNEHKTDATCGNEDCLCTAAMPVEQWNSRAYLKEIKACNDEYEALEVENQAYEECAEDHRRLVREIDVAINGEAGAAKQASLCDLVGQIKGLAAPVSDIEISAISLVTSEHLRLTDSTAWLNIGMKNIQTIVEFSLKSLLKARVRL